MSGVLTLKSCSSIFATSNRKRFQPFSGFPFQSEDAQEETEEVIVSSANAKQISADSPLTYPVLSELDGISHLPSFA